MERALGREVDWAAVNHDNPDRPHVHIIVRGVDRSGRERRLDRGYISNGLRWSAQEIATEELGPRQELDVRRAHAKEITQERFTSIDRELERRTFEGRLDIRALARPGRIDSSTLVARLEHLERLRLAERLSAWSLSFTEGSGAPLRGIWSRRGIP